MNNNRRFTLNTNQNIIVEFTNEHIIPASGLAVVGALLGKSDFAKKLNRMDVTKNRSQHQIKNGDIILTYIGMLCMGKPYFEAVHEMDSINFELHEGKQHCQNGTIEFLQETIRFCKKLTDQPLLVHLDSGNDSIDNIAVLIDAGCYFIIKRNLRRESKDGWFDI